MESTLPNFIISIILEHIIKYKPISFILKFIKKFSCISNNFSKTVLSKVRIYDCIRTISNKQAQILMKLNRNLLQLACPFSSTQLFSSESLSCVRSLDNVSFSDFLEEDFFSKKFINLETLTINGLGLNLNGGQWKNLTSKLSPYNIQIESCKPITKVETDYLDFIFKSNLVKEICDLPVSDPHYANYIYTNMWSHSLNTSITTLYLYEITIQENIHLFRVFVFLSNLTSLSIEMVTFVYDIKDQLERQLMKIRNLEVLKLSDLSLDSNCVCAIFTIPTLKSLSLDLSTMNDNGIINKKFKIASITELEIWADHGSDLSKYIELEPNLTLKRIDSECSVMCNNLALVKMFKNLKVLDLQCKSRNEFENFTKIVELNLPSLESTSVQYDTPLEEDEVVICRMANSNKIIKTLTLFVPITNIEDIISFCKMNHPSITSVSLHLRNISISNDIFSQLIDSFAENTTLKSITINTHTPITPVQELNYLYRIFKVNTTLEKLFFRGLFGSNQQVQPTKEEYNKLEACLSTNTSIDTIITTYNIQHLTNKYLIYSYSCFL